MKIMRLFAALIGIAAAHPAFAQKPFPKGLPEDDTFFPLAVWLQSPNNAEQYQDIGINLYIGLWKGPTDEQLDRLEQAGMPVICDQPEDLEPFRDRSIIVGWMHGDEPDNAQSKESGEGYGPPIPPETIIRHYHEMNKRDPERPVFLNLGQGVAWDDWPGRGVRANHPEDYPKYVQGCDIVSFDIYPASSRREAVAGNLWYVPRGVRRLREWTEASKPVWCCIETTQINNPEVGPTPEQVRSEVWMALIEGASGIIYFAHQFQPRFIEAGLLADEEMRRAVGALNREIQDLAPVLNSPNHEAGLIIESSNPDVPISSMVKRHAGSLYIFAVSLRDAPTQGAFRLPEFGDAKIEVLGENRSIQSQSGAWKDDFEGHEVHLYRVPERTRSAREPSR